MSKGQENDFLERVGITVNFCKTYTVQNSENDPRKEENSEMGLCAVDTKLFIATMVRKHSIITDGHYEAEAE